MLNNEEDDEGFDVWRWQRRSRWRHAPLRFGPAVQEEEDGHRPSNQSANLATHATIFGHVPELETACMRMRVKNKKTHAHNRCVTWPLMPHVVSDCQGCEGRKVGLMILWIVSYKDNDHNVFVVWQQCTPPIQVTDFSIPHERVVTFFKSSHYF